MWPAFLLIPLVALFRVLVAWQIPVAGVAAPSTGSLASWLPGFCPLSAVALCAGAFLPRRLALVVPLLILFASDVVIDFHYAAPLFTASMLGRYLLLGLIGVMGTLVRRSQPGARGFGSILLGTVAASTFFYVASNTLVWAGSPGYAQSFTGWTQALTTGLPGWLPSWVFYRNALVSDCLYSMVFVACLARENVLSFKKDAALAPAVLV